MRTVENSPRFSISQLKALDEWPEIVAQEEATIRIEHEGAVVTTTVKLDFDQTPFGRRPWLSCPACNRRRKHLFIEGGELKCRGCLKLLYYIQRVPGSSWRTNVVVPLFRSLREKPWGRLQLAEQG